MEAASQIDYVTAKVEAQDQFLTGIKKKNLIGSKKREEPRDPSTAGKASFVLQRPGSKRPLTETQRSLISRRYDTARAQAPVKRADGGREEKRGNHQSQLEQNGAGERDAGVHS